MSGTDSAGSGTEARGSGGDGQRMGTDGKPDGGEGTGAAPGARADAEGLVDPHPSSRPTTLWPGLDDEEHSRWYVERFRGLAAGGDDVEGESRLVDVLAPRNARLLDAGCGPGRHGGHLSRLGHRVVGVDIDPVLVAAAREDHPDATWLVADLVTLDLTALGEPDPFDGVLLAGNVMDFVPGPHRPEALRRVAAHVRPGGFVLLGCRTGRGFTPAELDAVAPAAGLRLEHRFATWDLRPWEAGASFCVSVLRRSPAAGAGSGLLTGRAAGRPA